MKINIVFILLKYVVYLRHYFFCKGVILVQSFKQDVMKKLSLIGKVAVTMSLVLCLMACQKQQDATVDQATDSNIIQMAAGTGKPSGDINRDDAADLAETYKKSSNGGTEYVAFKIKDLQLFLNNIQAKYKSDEVYVNFGVYTDKTAPSKDLIGRTTIFFSGNNKKKTLGGIVKTNDLAELDFSDYLNHGQVYP